MIRRSKGFTLWVNAKYDTDLPVSFFAENACFRLDPRWAFGLDDADFTGTPTRWDFGDELETGRVLPQ